MDKILKIEAEKTERQRRILRSLNLDDGKHIKVVGEQCTWNPEGSLSAEKKKGHTADMQEIFYWKSYRSDETGNRNGERPEEKMQMKKQQIKERQNGKSRQTAEELQKEKTHRAAGEIRSDKISRIEDRSCSRKTGQTERDSLNEELSRIIMEKQAQKTGPAEMGKQSGRMYEEGTGWQSHKFQCAVLGMAALILAGLAVFQQSGGRVKPVSSQPGRIVTAGTGQEDFSASQTTEGSPVSQNASVHDSNLILVNKEHGLPEDYTVDIHWLNNGRVAVADEMYDALSAMLTDGSVDGREFVVASGYRSYEQQQELLEEDIQASMEKYGLTWQEAYDKESQETMPEGHSEHETGLAVDLVALDYQMLDAAQEYTEENQWLQEHCQEYGFILRYPRGKENVTGISYESWHFRYVGTDAAKEIMERGITLEEYLGEIG